LTSELYKICMYLPIYCTYIRIIIQRYRFLRFHETNDLKTIINSGVVKISKGWRGGNKKISINIINTISIAIL